MGRGKPPLDQMPVVTHVNGPRQLRDAVLDYSQKTGMSKSAIARWALAMWAESMGYGHMRVPVTVYTNTNGDVPQPRRDAETYIEEGYPQ